MHTFPDMATIRQPVPTAPLADVAGAVRAELARIDLATRIRPGARIAVGAGSRGITDYALVVRTIVEELRRYGAEPFIFPAMGSHGGATAEGQLEVLETWGITPATMGCMIYSSMEVVRVGETPTGLPVFCDAMAFASDGIIVVNRVKIHTDFHGPTESGLTKMLAIGLGKRQGAEAIHAHGTRGLRDEIPLVAALQISRAPILGGVAIVEDGAHHVSIIRAVPAAAIAAEEPRLLERARELRARLPFDACDLLIVDWMGKDISGAGMDNNVLGRMRIAGEAEPETPRIGLVYTRRLTPASHGNATGIGFADLVAQPLVDAMDAEITRVNVETSGFLLRGVIPPVLPNDRAALAYAFDLLAARGIVNPTLMRIQSTLHLEELQISANLVAAARLPPEVAIIREPGPMIFEPTGDLMAYTPGGELDNID